MVEKFTLQVAFGEAGTLHPVQVYIGSPRRERHPLQFQAHWLTAERGGIIPPAVMESFHKLHNIAKENKVKLEELCVYAFTAAGEKKEETKSNPGGKIINIQHASQYIATKQHEPAPAQQPAKQEPDKNSGQSAAITYKEYLQQTKILWRYTQDIFATETSINRKAQTYFFALLGYEAADPSQPVSAVNIYRHLTGDDRLYNLCVVLDTIGTYLPTYSYRIIEDMVMMPEKELSRHFADAITALENACRNPSSIANPLTKNWLSPLQEFLSEGVRNA